VANLYFHWWAEFGELRPAPAANEAGCWLGNFDVTGQTPCEAPSGDGFRFTAPVDAYFLHGFGTFQMSGNVAEMTDQDGMAKGGSWAHSPEESHLHKRQAYEGHDYRVGFRIVMEIHEE
jgi:formylglycine-generating enzyme required for sulfatase activity